jgi:hypothetical protein
MNIAKNMEYIFLSATAICLIILALNPTQHTDIQVSAPVLTMVSTTSQG